MPQPHHEGYPPHLVVDWWLGSSVKFHLVKQARGLLGPKTSYNPVINGVTWGPYKWPNKNMGNWGEILGCPAGT